MPRVLLLCGGGCLGARQVGMMRHALAGKVVGMSSDLFKQPFDEVHGCSVGAINALFFLIKGNNHRQELLEKAWSSVADFDPDRAWARRHLCGGCCASKGCVRMCHGVGFACACAQYQCRPKTWDRMPSWISWADIDRFMALDETLDRIAAKAKEFESQSRRPTKVYIYRSKIMSDEPLTPKQGLFSINHVDCEAVPLEEITAENRQRIKRAVHASCSVPFIFSPVTERVVSTQPSDAEGSGLLSQQARNMFQDGGVFSSIPIPKQFPPSGNLEVVVMFTSNVFKYTTPTSNHRSLHAYLVALCNFLLHRYALLNLSALLTNLLKIWEEGDREVTLHLLIPNVIGEHNAFEWTQRDLRNMILETHVEYQTVKNADQAKKMIESISTIGNHTCLNQKRVLLF